MKKTVKYVKITACDYSVKNGEKTVYTEIFRANDKIAIHNFGMNVDETISTEYYETVETVSIFKYIASRKR